MSDKEVYGIVLSQKLTKDNVNMGVVMGTEKFTLKRIELNEDVRLKPQDKILITKDSEELKKTDQKLSYDDLSNEEQIEAEKAIHSIVIANENKYVGFFNKQSKDGTQLHLLEGISRKNSMKIIEEKELNGDFESFEDIDNRISFIDDSEDLIAKRVLYELSELNKVKKGRPTYLFASVKRSSKKEVLELDEFEDDDSFFIEKLKREGLVEQEGKRIR
ncbi:RNA-binding protein [Methanobrevibacter ruminantium M1]|uniref:RNA-binding protein n=1 Tax=Methanobrevibacter ruminantium (strain ATCC 35063 / DSM 1093 / JCM 13430 / OCM 146 / M1) TaxID=634498 RepID=D3E219_METRM|nr:DUF655 domain-containing protein [Methanobrevibacter ruminantium]ADC46580.1 RNA-binding protein [Methanobrevibacter ruminantium M1]